MPLSIYLFILIQLLFIAYQDYKTRKISNLWPLMNIGLFIGLLFLMPDYYKISGSTFFYSFIFLFVGFGLFLVKVMGAGDTKYLFSFFLILPLKFHEDFLLVLLMTTIIVGVILFIQNIVINYKKLVAYFSSGYLSGIKNIFGKRKFPYAPVILISWMIFGWFLIEQSKLI